MIVSMVRCIAAGILLSSPHDLIHTTRSRSPANPVPQRHHKPLMGVTPNPPPVFAYHQSGRARSKHTGRQRWFPPKARPNVLLIMTDDAGYGVSGTFGGVIPTPSARPGR
jgi:hypothetical protein